MQYQNQDEDVISLYLWSLTWSQFYILIYILCVLIDWLVGPLIGYIAQAALKFEVLVLMPLEC